MGGLRRAAVPDYHGVGAYQGSFQGRRPALYQVGSNYYFVALARATDWSTTAEVHTFRVYKTSDLDSFGTEQDSANRPSNTGWPSVNTQLNSAYWSTAWDATRNQIVLVYSEVDGAVRGQPWVMAFDTDTDTWVDLNSDSAHRIQVFTPTNDYPNTNNRSNICVTDDGDWIIEVHSNEARSMGANYARPYMAWSSNGGSTWSQGSMEATPDTTNTIFKYTGPVIKSTLHGGVYFLYSYNAVIYLGYMSSTGSTFSREISSASGSFTSNGQYAGGPGFTIPVDGTYVGAGPGNSYIIEDATDPTNSTVVVSSTGSITFTISGTADTTVNTSTPCFVPSFSGQQMYFVDFDPVTDDEIRVFNVDAVPTQATSTPLSVLTSLSEGEVAYQGDGVTYQYPVPYYPGSMGVAVNTTPKYYNWTPGDPSGDATNIQTLLEWTPPVDPGWTSAVTQEMVGSFTYDGEGWPYPPSPFEAQTNGYVDQDFCETVMHMDRHGYPWRVFGTAFDGSRIYRGEMADGTAPHVFNPPKWVLKFDLIEPSYTGSYGNFWSKWEDDTNNKTYLYKAHTDNGTTEGDGRIRIINCTDVTQTVRASTKFGGDTPTNLSLYRRTSDDALIACFRDFSNMGGVPYGAYYSKSTNDGVSFGTPVEMDADTESLIYVGGKMDPEDRLWAVWSDNANFIKVRCLNSSDSMGSVVTIFSGVAYWGPQISDYYMHIDFFSYGGTDYAAIVGETGSSGCWYALLERGDTPSVVGTDTITGSNNVAVDVKGDPDTGWVWVSFRSDGITSSTWPRLYADKTQSGTLTLENSGATTYSLANQPDDATPQAWDEARGFGMYINTSPLGKKRLIFSYGYWVVESEPNRFRLDAIEIAPLSSITQSLSPVTQALSGTQFREEIIQTLWVPNQLAFGLVIDHEGPIIQSTAAVTQSVTANNAITFSGDMAQTLTALTQAAEGTLIANFGSATQTLSALTQTATGELTFSATAEQVLSISAQSLTAELAFSGDLSQVSPLVAQAAVGAETFSGTTTQTTQPVQQAVDAFTGELVDGNAAQTLSALSQAASGSLAFSADVAQTVALTTQAATGEQVFTSTAEQNLSALSQAVQSELIFSATSAQTLSLVTQAASGTLAALEILVPDLDLNDGSWTNQIGSTTLWPSISETGAPNDGDYIRSALNPNNDTCRFRMTNPAEAEIPPGDRKVVYRIRQGNTGGDCSFTVIMYQGSTEIAQWTHTAPLPETNTTFEQTLTTEQANAVTNWNNVELELIGNQET